jgi:hypothetical protein
MRDAAGVDVVEHLRRRGGVASRGALVRLTSRAEVERALKSGAIVRDGRGRYGLPTAEVGLRAASALSGSPRTRAPQPSGDGR